MTRPNPHIALIYHYDLARALAGEVVDWQAIPVNVDAGREGGDLCRAAADFAKRRDLFAMTAAGRSIVVVPQNGEPCTATKVKSSDTSAVTESASTSDTPATRTSARDGGIATSGPEALTSDSGVAASSALNTDDPANRDRLRARIADLIDQDHEQAIRRRWPEGVEPLSREGHTEHQLELILAAVRRVETEVGAAWHPDDGPPPHSRIAIERALKAWEGRDPGTAWFAASLIATFEQCRNADSTFEELVAQFSISQADRLYDAAASQ